MMGRFAFVLLAGIWTLRAAEPASSAAAPADAAAKAPPRLDVLLRLKGVDLAANPAVRAALDRGLAATRGTPQFLELVRAFNLKDQAPGLIALAVAHPDESAGAEALQRALEDGGLEAIRAELGGPDASSLVRALGNAADASAVSLLTRLVTDTAKALSLRQAAVRSLARSEAGAKSLVALARAGKIPEELKPLAATQLDGIPWEEIKNEAAKLFSVATAPLGAVPALATILALQGDATRGAKIFQGAAACAACHQVNGQGIDFGPPLSQIGDKFDKQGLYSATVDPSAGIAFGYETWQITLKNGSAFGIITSETDDEIAVKAPGNIVTRYRKSDVTERKSMPGSIMPAGLLQPLPLQDIADLLEYLSQLRKSR